MIYENVCKWSVQKAVSKSTFNELVNKLRKIAPDISKQELSGTASWSDYFEIKRRALQAFQCSMMLRAIELVTSDRKITVVDVGDSAGTHMLYLKALTKGKFDIDSISVNLDPAAIKKIQGTGQEAILCRAEDLDLGGQQIDLITSFQMVEHLHNPAIFFRRIAKKSKCNRMLITVPYIRRSRVGLHSIRNNLKKNIVAEEEHVFELSPDDWTLLFLHSGWKIIYNKIYFQYPRRLFFLFRWLWKKTDYEGFWGAILEKDLTYSDLYQDWEEC